MNNSHFPAEHDSYSPFLYPSSVPASALGISPTTFSNDVPFQIPSFLAGPISTPGAGADVIHGNDPAAFGPDFASWYAPNKQNSASVSPRLSSSYQPSPPPLSLSLPSSTKYFSHQDPGLNVSYRVPASAVPFDFSHPHSASRSTQQKRFPEDAATSSRQSSSRSPQFPTSALALPVPVGSAGASGQSPFQSLRMPVDPANQFGLYSTTGFDMMGILSRVVNRPNPIINLGPVDFTCSFTVVDIRRYDAPIVYASPTFLKLTGYSADEVRGKNCRFLQAPDGVVTRASPRQYTDPDAVAHLRKSLAAQKECQASLLNYRKGGQPFINLVSIVPIPWGDSDDIVYHVGFQVDLVEQPNAILHEMQNGKYVFNYSSVPQSVMDDRNLRREAGVSKEMRDMAKSMAAKSLGTAQVTDEQILQELHVLLLENSDDFIHVLSLKGNFLYVSPSVTRILEYSAEDLLGKSISDICHPSDIVSVLRELKDSSHMAPEDYQQQQSRSVGQSPTASAKPVSYLLRVRRKHSGYVWLECSGRLYVEQGKGRKAIVLTGRKREMPRLAWSTIGRAGGLAEPAFWCKTSVDGHFLNVAEAALQQAFGWPATDMVGTNLLYQWIPVHVERDNVRMAMQTCSVSGDPVRVSCHMGPSHDNMVAVAMCFYPLDVPSRGSDADTNLAPWIEQLSTAAKRRQTELICQVHPLSCGRVIQPSANLTSTDENLFLELETARSTSFQYEFQQKRNENAELRAEIDALARDRRERGRSVSTSGPRTQGHMHVVMNS